MSLPTAVHPPVRRFSARTLGAVGLSSVLVLPLGGAPSQAAAVALPKPGVRLPSALDVAPPYQKGYRCLTSSLPGPVAVATLLNSTYGPYRYGVLRTCDQEHGEGRALDWMISAEDREQRAIGDTLTRWLAAKDSQGRPGAMARRLGINYIIWNRQIWKAWAPERGWAAYTGSSPHTDHIHLSFTWDGAYQRTSWWTGKAVTTYLTGPTTSAPEPPGDLAAWAKTVLRRGARGDAVKALQRSLGQLEVDGSFGPATEARVKSYQRSRKLAVTGVVDATVWAALMGKASTAGSTSPVSKYAGVTLRLWSRGEAVKALQRSIGKLTVDGSFGPKTLARVKVWQKSKGLAVDGVIDAKDWKVLGGGSATQPTTTKPTTKPSTARPTLRRGDSGAAVRTLQALIGSVAVDGRFGPRTEARLRAVQRSLGLSATGVADARTWAALDARAHPLKPYYGTVLKLGSRGKAVVALQKALRITPDGSFGPQTRAAVKAAQKASRIAQTGVVGTVTWKAIETRMR